MRKNFAIGKKSTFFTHYFYDRGFYMNSSIQKVIRIIPLAVIAMTLDFQVLAQLNPRSTLYAFHQSSYNPAICGASEYGNASAVIRKQYMGFVDNAGPATTWIDFSMPIKSINSGAGLSIAQTKEGFEKRLSAKLNYAYQLDLRTGRLGFGLSAGLNSAQWDMSDARYPDGSSDNFVETTIASQEKFSNLLLGFGMFYQVGSLYAGFAVTELNEPALKYDAGKMDYLKRHYWLSMGYDYKTASPKWTLCPALTLKTTFSEWQLNGDIRAIYNNFVITGLSYNSSHDLSLNIGVQFKDGSKLDGLKAIFSYDIVSSKIGGESAGSVEVMVSYDFNIFMEKENKTYKSVRFL